MAKPGQLHGNYDIWWTIQTPDLENMISLILRSIEYDLPATKISMPKVDRNESTLYQETLLSLGANINFTKQLICLPAECLGLYLPHPYI